MSLKAPALLGEEAVAAMKVYLQALADKGLVSHALSIAGITLSQLDTFREDPTFRDLEKEAELFQDDKLREAINNFVAMGDRQVIISAMRKLPEYNQSTKNMNVNVSGQITHKAIAALPEAEIDRLISEGAKLIELEPGKDYEES